MKLQTRRKYLEIIYPTNDLYPDYIKNSQNSILTNNPTKKWAKHFTK